MNENITFATPLTIIRIYISPGVIDWAQFCPYLAILNTTFSRKYQTSNCLYIHPDDCDGIVISVPGQALIQRFQESACFSGFGSFAVFYQAYLFGATILYYESRCGTSKNGAPEKVNFNN